MFPPASITRPCQESLDSSAKGVGGLHGAASFARAAGAQGTPVQSSILAGPASTPQKEPACRAAICANISLDFEFLPRNRFWPCACCLTPPSRIVHERSTGGRVQHACKIVPERTTQGRVQHACRIVPQLTDGPAVARCCHGPPRVGLPEIRRACSRGERCESSVDGAIQ